MNNLVRVRIEAKAKNAILARLVDECGGVGKAAEAVGVCQNTFSRWLNFKNEFGGGSSGRCRGHSREKRKEVIFRLEQLTGEPIRKIFPLSKEELEPLAEKRVYERVVERKALEGYARHEAMRLEHQMEESSAEKVFSRIEVRDKLEEAHRNGNLNDREYDMISLLYGIRDGKPKTLEEVATMYERSRERIRQIVRKGLRKLRLLWSETEL